MPNWAGQLAGPAGNMVANTGALESPTGGLSGGHHGLRGGALIAGYRKTGNCSLRGSYDVYVVSVGIEQQPFGNAAEYISAG